MSMSYLRADQALNNALRNGSVFLWLHTGDPGVEGTDNVAQGPDENEIARKPISFGEPENHPTENRRRCLSDSKVSWDGEEIATGEKIQYFSIWDSDSNGQVEFISDVASQETTGSQGVTIQAGDVECEIEVHEKPAEE